MRQICLITGATSGIGKATALLLAANGYDLVITGRREGLLEKTAGLIRKDTGAEVLSLCFDVRDRGSTEQALTALPGKWKQVDVLVNNAGLAAGLSHLDEGDIEDWETMIDTNIKGLLYVSRIVSQWMIARKMGHIINISSIAGKEVYESGNVYCATKYAVEALTKGMRIDLLKHGIRVTNIAPGMVETEFSLVRFRGDKEKAAAVYKGLTPLYAADIAEVVLFAVTRPQHVNINDILIMPTAQASATNVYRKTINPES
jgi:3-hydroxy acid dehydrogenase/malonic semialdehyde reductase